MAAALSASVNNILRVTSWIINVQLSTWVTSGSRLSLSGWMFREDRRILFIALNAADKAGKSSA